MIRRFQPSDDPPPCRECNGEGEYHRTPCCRASFTQPDENDLRKCSKCGEPFKTLTCPECHGKGIQAE